MPQPPRSAFEIVLFHSLLGRRPAVVDWGRRLAEAGYTVHVPDLYDGHVFDDMRRAAEWLRDGFGFDGVLARAAEAVAGLTPNLVYAGFSNGGACAELLAATRPGARAAIFMHAPLQLRDLGWSEWPAGVPAQSHFAEGDPIRDPATIDSLATRVRASGATWQQFTYRSRGHLFADPELAVYDATAADAMWNNVIAFLGSL